MDGTSIPTLRPTIPSKRSTPRASTAELHVPKLSIPLETKIPFLPAPVSQRVQSRSTRSMANSQSEAVLPNIKPKLIFPSTKKILPSDTKQPIKVNIPVPAEIVTTSRDPVKRRTKIKPIAAFNFKREIKTPCFSINALATQRKIGMVSESESCGSESTALPQSGEISGYELTPGKKSTGGETNKEAYDRIKKLILESESGMDDPREMSFGNIGETRKSFKLTTPRRHYGN